MIWIILFLIVVLISGYQFSNRKLSNEQSEKIPGPKGVFIFGNSLDFLMDFVETFYYLKDVRAKYVNGYKLSMGGKTVMILYNPEDVEILISGTKFNNKGFVYSFLRPWLNDGLLLSDETAMGIALDEESSEIGKTYKDGIHTLGTYLYHRLQRIWMYPDIIFNYSSVGRSQRRILNLLTSFRKKVIDKRRENSDYRNLFTEVLNGDKDDVFITKKKRLAMLDLLLEAEKQGSN